MPKILLKGGPADGKEIELPDNHQHPPTGLTQPVWEEGTANLLGWAVYLQTDPLSWVLEFSHINAELQSP